MRLPLLGRNTHPLAVQALRNVKILQRMLVTIVSKAFETIVVELPRSEPGRPGLLRLLPGTLAVAKLNCLEAVSHKTCRSPVHLGLK
jgi:hypothetical protein